MGRLVRDLMGFPELAIMENLHFGVVLAAHYAFYRYGGIQWALFVSAWSSIICQLATLYFNAAFHTPDHEEDRFPGACQARDKRERAKVLQSRFFPWKTPSFSSGRMKR